MTDRLGLNFHPTYPQQMEDYRKESLNAVVKSLNLNEIRVKEKHVRTLIIGTFKEQGASTFWQLLFDNVPVHANEIVAWKFCFILHRMIQDGHKMVVVTSMKHMNFIDQLRSTWDKIKVGYGPLVSRYCVLNKVKMNFHNKHPNVPGNLVVDSEFLQDPDVSVYFELTIDFFDYMDAIIKLEKAIFSSFGTGDILSLTNQSQCRIAPLAPCIYDASHLYDILLDMLRLLHQHLPYDSLDGHRDRFNGIHKELYKFFSRSSNIRFLKDVCSVPTIGENPPEFIDKVPATPDDATEDILNANQYLIAEVDNLTRKIHTLQSSLAQVQNEKMFLVDESNRQKGMVQQQRGEYEAQLKRYQQMEESYKQEIAHLKEMSAQAMMVVQNGNSQSSEEAEKFTKLKEAYFKLRQDHIGLLRKKAEEGDDCHNQAANAVQVIAQLKEGIAELNEKIGESKNRLNQIGEVQAQSIERTTEKVQESENKLQILHDRVRANGEFVVGLKDKVQSENVEIKSLQDSYTALKESFQKSIDNYELQKGMTEKEMADVKAANEDILNERNSLAKEIQELKNNFKSLQDQWKDCLLNELNVDNMDEDGLDELFSRVLDHITALKSNFEHSHLHRIQLGVSAVGMFITAKESKVDMDQCKSILSETKRIAVRVIDDEAPEQRHDNIDALGNSWESLRISLKTHLAENPDDDISAILAKELLAMEDAVAAAADLMEKLMLEAKQNYSGQQLEVNTKIIDSCQTLVAAIRQLILRAKLLQEEITAGQPKEKQKEFYKRNAKWSEGLISAAKSVGAGANLLVEAANEICNNNGEFEPLIAASQEVSATTVQLVIASKVKAKKDSTKLGDLSKASKDVTQATAALIAVCKTLAKAADEQQLDFSHLTPHQTKMLEMETQVRVLQLEHDLEMERKKLFEIRKHHYANNEVNS